MRQTLCLRQTKRKSSTYFVTSARFSDSNSCLYAWLICTAVAIYSAYTTHSSQAPVNHHPGDISIIIIKCERDDQWFIYRAQLILKQNLQRAVQQIINRRIMANVKKWQIIYNWRRKRASEWHFTEHRAACKIITHSSFINTSLYVCMCMVFVPTHLLCIWPSVFSPNN